MNLAKSVVAVAITMIREGRSYAEIEEVTGFNRESVEKLGDWAFDYAVFPEA